MILTIFHPKNFVDLQEDFGSEETIPVKVPWCEDVVMMCNLQNIAEMSRLVNEKGNAVFVVLRWVAVTSCLNLYFQCIAVVLGSTFVLVYLFIFPLSN